MDLPPRVGNQLRRRGLTRDDIARMCDADILQLPNIGPKGLATIRAIIPHSGAG